MDAAIATANTEIGAAAAKVRRCGGIGEGLADIQAGIGEAEQQRIVDASLRRIRRVALGTCELEQEAAAMEVDVSELQELVRLYDSKREEGDGRGTVADRNLQTGCFLTGSNRHFSHSVENIRN